VRQRPFETAVVLVTHRPNDRKGEVILGIVLWGALGAAAVGLSAKRAMQWPGIFLASATAFVLLLTTFRQAGLSVSFGI